MSVIDEKDVLHEVVGILIKESIDVTVVTPGIDDAAAAAVGPEVFFWSFWEGTGPIGGLPSASGSPKKAVRQRIALLHRKHHQLVPYDEFEGWDENVIITGHIRYGTPMIGRWHAVRLSSSARVTSSDGTEHRSFSRGAELIADGTLEPVARR